MVQTKLAPPNIYNYLDYRKYLTDVFTYLKKDNPRFSYRSFAKLVGSSSPNYLQLINKRKIKINTRAINFLAKKLGLKKKEGLYFDAIIGFDHARTHEEKNSFYQRILQRKKYSTIKELDRHEYEYYSHWYNPVVRELVTHPGYTDDPAWIAKRIFPPVSVPHIKRSIEILQNLNLIQRDPHAGYWAQTNTSISTPSEVKSLVLMNYHKAVLAIARQSLVEYKAQQRDFRSVTIGISKSKYNELKSKMEAFWKEILDQASKETSPEEVYQLNLQLFPLTKEGKE